jgi:uncharacterized membrane protein YjjB (DUF3815 family)
MKGSAYDLTKLCELDNIATDVAKQYLTIDDALEMVHSVVEKKTGKRQWLEDVVTIVSNTICGAAFSLFFEGTYMEVAASLVAAFFVGMLMVLATKINFIAKILKFASALAACLVGVLFKVIVHIVNNKYGQGTLPQVSETLVAVSGALVQTPGLTFMLSIIELAVGNFAAGSFRLLSGFAAVLQMSFGVLVGVKISLLAGLSDSFVARARYPLWVYALALFPVAFTFGILLKAPRYALTYVCIILAAYAAYFSSYYTSLYLGKEIGAAVGQFSICMVANLYSRLSRHPSNVVTTCSVILLLPGTVGIRSLSALIQGDLPTSLNFIITLLLGPTGLAIGFTCANFLLAPRQKLW